MTGCRGSNSGMGAACSRSVSEPNRTFLPGSTLASSTPGSRVRGSTVRPTAHIQCAGRRRRRSIQGLVIFGLFNSCSERRHTTHEHRVEGRIYYRFHPRCGETVLIKRQLENRGVELVVIVQPDSSLACIPAWMTHVAAAQYALCDKPHFSVDILRSLRAEINALLGFLQPESKAEEAVNVVSIQRSPTKPVRGIRGASSRVGDRTDGRSRGIGGNSSARDRDSAGKRGGQR